MGYQTAAGLTCTWVLLPRRGWTGRRGGGESGGRESAVGAEAEEASEELFVKQFEHAFEGSFVNGLRHGLGVEIVRVVDPDIHDGVDGGNSGGVGFQEWVFYAGGWESGRRHGTGVEGSVVLSEDDPDCEEPEKEEADFTCLGHSTHIVFCPCSVVEYVWGIKDAQVLAALIGCDASCGHVLSSS